MKNLEELDEKLEKTNSLIRYMKEMAEKKNAPEEAKQIARETLTNLEEEKQKILKEIRD
ncbi:MAG: hypothetical protein UW07_C0020G0002 [Candidatus Nomurabacteria bacterium GW2011_GWF2_43_8]|uniref:Uncharacterized protein n=2 Tax=Candidatus Nomuraibacteriota TaxID=1752729 RepID=A0A0G1HW88_9BACT|nr:MAG: hypothetical protein UV76_C0018G0006 [Candidatus Nomurabacteria bacterium GW2011_GWA2_43_15]KKT23902.1 MAG: hypothetical protein UW07_C0020G0002 [Candidatus Nomurabacteria bacterium GW2011_GWF2_43_8]